MVTGRVWRAHAFGDPASVLHLEEECFASPPQGRILVRVAAAGIGLPDLLLLGGRFPGVSKPPITPGQEVVGEVVEIAKGSNFAIGDRVMGMTPFMEGQGDFGEYAFVVEAKAIHAPDLLSDEMAAGFLIGFRTAHAAFVDRAPIRAGQTVLILGGAGSSGAAAIQLATAPGARVTAVAGGPEKCAFCLRIGASAAIDHKAVADLSLALREAAGPSGIDLIFDPVGGATAKAAAITLGRGDAWR
jgi:NADPH:quinone reductase